MFDVGDDARLVAHVHQEVFDPKDAATGAGSRPLPELDHVIHVLLVIAECFRRISSKPLPKVTDEMLEAAARKLNAMSKLLQGDADETARMTELIVEAHPERDLFVYVLGYLDEQGMTLPSPAHEHAVFAAAVVLEVFMQAAAQAEETAG